MRGYIRSLAFRRGFVRGFTSPYAFVFGHRRKYHTQPTDIVAAAWRDVGLDLTNALTEEGGRREYRKEPKPPSTKPRQETLPFEDEIDRQIGDHVPQKMRKELVQRVSKVVVSEIFSGPIAHPKHLDHYEQICPGAADRIIRMAENKAEHFAVVEQAEVRAAIDDEKRGMWLGASLFALLILAALAVALITRDRILTGLFLGAAAIGGVGLFVNRRNGK